MLLASRIVGLTGGVSFFVASFFTWYWGEARGIRHTEIAWQGEESLAAIICMLIAIMLLGVGWAWRDGWLAMGILELILTIACFGLTIFHIIHNSQPVIVYGQKYPSGISAGPWIGLFAGVVMIVGAILNLCSGGPFPTAVEYDDDEYDPPPRRRRPREYDDHDDWDEPPRRGRRRPQPRPPRRRELG
jgi:hypothetical protein